MGMAAGTLRQCRYGSRDSRHEHVEILSIREGSERLLYRSVHHRYSKAPTGGVDRCARQLLLLFERPEDPGVRDDPGHQRIYSRKLRLSGREGSTEILHAAGPDAAGSGTGAENRW